MRSFRLKIILAIVAVSWLSAILMQLFNGLFFQRDLAAILPGLDLFAIVVVTITALASTLIFLQLRPLARTVARLDAGRAVVAEERVAARKCLGTVNKYIFAVNVLGFFIGPIASIAMRGLAGHASFSFLDSVLLILLNLGIGMMAGLQQMTLCNRFTMDIRDKLEIVDRIPGVGDFKIATRFGLPGIAAIFMAGVMFALASIGILREYTAWLAAAGQDALSSATSVGAEAVNINELEHLGELAALFAVVVAWTVLLFASVARVTKAQAARLGDRMRSVAEGSADLTSKLGIIYFDELGDLTVSFNSVIGNVAALVKGVKELSGGVVASAETLERNSEEAARAALSMESSSARVRASLESQRAAVGGTDAVIGKLARSIEVVGDHVATQAGFVEESSAAIAEMAANITSASRLAAQAEGLASSLSSSAEGGGGAMRALAVAIAEIDAASRSVAELVGAISRIASQTNLLAMNAAIEAAHAGDAGAGFAVVADEVRALAETSARSAKDIIAVIRSMGAKIAAGVGQAEDASRAFGEIAGNIAQTTQLVNTIAQAMGEQKVGAEEILSSTNSLIEATEKIRDLTVEQKELSGEMGDSMGAIRASVREIEGAATEQDAGTRTLADVIARVKSEAERNAEGAEALGKSIDGFKLG